MDEPLKHPGQTDQIQIPLICDEHANAKCKVERTPCESQLLRTELIFCGTGCGVNFSSRNTAILRRLEDKAD